MDDWSEAALRERIEMTRSRMSTTIAQIGDHVSPERVRSRVKSRLKSEARDRVDDVRDAMRRRTRRIPRRVKRAGRGIWSTVRENPVPAGIVGAGLVWLLGHDRDRESVELDDDGARTASLLAGAVALAVGVAAGMLFDSKDDDASAQP